MAKLNQLQDLKKLFPDAVGSYQKEIISSPTPSKKQQLEAHFSNKGRAGKTVTIIKGFDHDFSDIKLLAKEIKNHCGVGGSVKDSEIIIQGNMRDNIMLFLQQKGHHVKRVGG